MGSALWRFIQEEHAVKRPRHLARQPCRPTLLFVKNVPRLTIYGHERASLLLREPGDVLYKTGPDQPHIRDRVMGRARWTGRDQRRAVAGAAGDTVDAPGLKGLGEGHRRQDEGEAPGQHSGHRTDASAYVICWPTWSGGVGVQSRATRDREHLRVRARCGHSHLPGSQGCTACDDLGRPSHRSSHPAIVGATAVMRRGPGVLAAHSCGLGVDPASPTVGPGIMHGWDFPCPRAVRRYTTALCMPGPLNVKSVHLERRRTWNTGNHSPPC
jgi:hypothetical protein